MFTSFCLEKPAPLDLYLAKELLCKIYDTELSVCCHFIIYLFRYKFSLRYMLIMKEGSLTFRQKL